MSSTESMCQQSPSLGNFPTGATSAHHFVTPTSSFCAPIAHKMDVALGANEAMRKAALREAIMFMEENSRGDGAPPTDKSGLTRPCEYDALRSLISGGPSCDFFCLLLFLSCRFPPRHAHNLRRRNPK